MKRVLIALLVLSLGLMAGPAAAATLWYNGDFNSWGNCLSNSYQYDSRWGGHYASISHVYDDFVVPAGGWTVNAVWSNNLFSDYAGYQPIDIYAATWQIRSGVSAGNGGTVVAEGSGTPAITPTGRTAINGSYVYTEYQILVGGLNVNLAPGRYWLRVTPSRTFDPYQSQNFIANSTTSGLNAVGDPPGNNGNSFFYCYSESYGGQKDTPWNFANWYGYNFSMGIAGTAILRPRVVPSLVPLLFQ
jgi:hypothetical protein